MKALAIALVLAGTQLASTQLAAADRLEEARKHFVAGKTAHDEGRYDEAIKEYQAAFDLAPLPELLFNLGQVYRLKGDKQKALDHYAKYLVVAPKGPVAGEARKYQAQLEKELAAEPKPPPDPTPKPEPQPPPPAPIVQPEQPQPPPEPRDDGSPGRGLRITGLVLGGVGIVAAGAAIKFGVDARSAASDVSERGDDIWTQDDIDRVEQGERAEKIALVATGVAAVAIGTGAVLYFMGKRAERANVAFVPREGGGVFALGGRF